MGNYKQNDVVKLFTNDDNDPVNIDEICWHLVDPVCRQGASTLCTQEFFGLGESNCKFIRAVGIITCPQCIAKLKIYQNIKIGPEIEKL